MGIDFAIGKTRRDTGCCHNHTRRAASIVDQCLGPCLKPHTIDEDNVRLCHSFGISSIWLIEMRIGIGADDGCHIRKITGHLMNHVPQNGETCHNLNPV